MTVAGSYDDMVADVLQAVSDTIAAAKTTLGVKSSRVGNDLRGWVPPAAFVFLGPAGAPRTNRSRSRGVWDHDVHVDVVIVGPRDAQRSRDIDVLKILGKLPGVIKAAMPLDRTRHFTVENAGEIGAFLDRTGGAYETQGRLQLLFESEAETGRP